MAKEIIRCEIKTDELVYGSDPNKQNPNDLFNMSVLESVKKIGVIEPLVVLNLRNGLIVRTGNTRLWAARKCGIDKLDCIVVTLERDVGKSKKINGRKINNIQSEFKYPIVWNEDKNFVSMKCTHFHINHSGVV